MIVFFHVGSLSELEFATVVSFCDLRTVLNMELTARSVRTWLRTSTLVWRMLCAQLLVPVPAALNSPSASNLALRLRDLYVDNARFAFVDAAAFDSASLNRGALVRRRCVEISGVARIRFFIGLYEPGFRFARSVLPLNLPRSGGLRLRISVELNDNEFVNDVDDDDLSEHPSNLSPSPPRLSPDCLMLGLSTDANSAPICRALEESLGCTAQATARSAAGESRCNFMYSVSPCVKFHTLGAGEQRSTPQLGAGDCAPDVPDRHAGRWRVRCGVLFEAR
jgi:hypothetical protein